MNIGCYNNDVSISTTPRLFIVEGESGKPYNFPLSCCCEILHMCWRCTRVYNNSARHFAHTSLMCAKLSCLLCFIIHYIVNVTVYSMSKDWKFVNLGKATGKIMQFIQCAVPYALDMSWIITSKKLIWLLREVCK